MLGANKRYLSFSINESVIKLVQATSSGVVEKVARGSAADSSVEALGGTLKTLLNGFDRSSAVVCVIPASAATSKTIEVPSTDPQEIRSIINLQVGRHTPYSREEVLIGYINLGQGSPNHTKVFLVIVHRNIVKDRLNVLERASLQPDKVLFVPEGIGRLYCKGLNLKKDSSPVGVIDVALSSVNFLVASRGSVTFSRSIPIGVKQLVESQESVNKLLEEINTSLAAYMSEDAVTPIGSFVLTTDSDVVKNLPSALKESLKSDVHLSSYIQFINAGSVKNKLQRDFADDSFLDVIAAASNISKCEINLMPEEMIVKKSVEKQSKEAIKTVVAVLIILVLLGGAMMSKIYFKQAFLNHNLKEKYAAQKEEVVLLQERLNKLNVVKNYLSGRMVSLDVIHELYRVTPTQIYLNVIALNDDGSLMVSGVSDSMSRVFSYVKALSDSPMFKNVKTKSTATKKDNGKDVAVFELNLELKDLS